MECGEYDDRSQIASDLTGLGLLQPRALRFSLSPSSRYSYSYLLLLSLSLSLSPAMFAAALRPATLRAFPRALAQPRLVPAFAAISTRSISRSSPFPLFGLARLGR